MIVFDNVTKAYKTASGQRRVILSGVDLVVHREDHIAIMAPKLQGKTTLVRMFTGFEPPDSGTITRYCEISYPVGLYSVLSMNMTGRENVAFVSRVFNCDPSEIIRFVEEHAGLGPALDREVHHYALDEKMRLSHVLSYAIPFDIYVFDGAVGRGSDSFRKKCTALFEARAESAGVLFATGNPATARAYCKKVLVIDDGRLTLHDDVESGIEHFNAAKARVEERRAAAEI